MGVGGDGRRGGRVNYGQYVKLIKKLIECFFKVAWN